MSSLTVRTVKNDTKRAASKKGQQGKAAVIAPVFHPLPMQYLGSKSRISRWLLDSIKKELPKANQFFDLFSGTGAVALEAAARDYDVFANDIQPYSYAVLKALLQSPKNKLEKLIPKLESLKSKKEMLRGERSFLRPYLSKEDAFIKARLDQKLQWISYKKFCNETPIVKSNKDLAGTAKSNSWSLFSHYFANNYFGIRQVLEIDCLRELADSLSAKEREVLLAAVISVLTFAVSSTTHLAQYIKPNSKKQAEFLIKKRSISIIDGAIDRLKRLQAFPNYKNGSVYNLDYKEALKAAPLSEGAIVYADPPYFKEHYSRYYHVLDTFYLYDYPKLTVNDRTSEITVGRYRDKRIVSDFGFKSKVADAFRVMLKTCYSKKLNLAISYADTSLIDTKTMQGIIAETGYTLTIKQIDLMHSAQGQPRNKIAIEYLYLLKRK